MHTSLKALIHPSVDQAGRHTFAVWVYDTDKPRGETSRLAAKFAAVKMLGVFKRLPEAEGALEAEGIPLLLP